MFNFNKLKKEVNLSLAKQAGKQTAKMINSKINKEVKSNTLKK